MRHIPGTLVVAVHGARSDVDQIMRMLKSVRYENETLD